MMQLAVRYGAISVNPVREVESIEHPTKKLARAIRTDEIKLLRKHLTADETAVRADLPAHTIVRIKGEGLLRKPTKSAAGNRQLGLPNWLVATLRTRAATGIRLDDPIFADTLGGYRDPNNVRRSLRTALAPVGSATRRDLGLALRAARREAGLTRDEVANTLS